MATIKELFAPLGMHESILDYCGGDPVSSIFCDAQKLACAAICLSKKAVWSAIVEILQIAYNAHQAYNAKYEDSGRFYEPPKVLAAIKQLALCAQSGMGSTHTQQLFQLSAEVATKWAGLPHDRRKGGWDGALCDFIAAAAQYSIGDKEYAIGQATDLMWEAIEEMYEGDFGDIFKMYWQDIEDFNERTCYYQVRNVLLETLQKHLFATNKEVAIFLRSAYHRT